MLRRLLIEVAPQRAKAKSDVLQKEVAQRALREMYNENLHELVDKTSIFLFFGLHRRLKTLETQAKGMGFSNSGETGTTFPHNAKRQAVGFSYKAPG